VRLPVVRLAEEGGAGAARADAVAVEAPLEVRLAGKPFTVLMRTPGDDEDLVRGFLFTEGVTARVDDLVRMRLVRTPAGDVAEVELVPGLAAEVNERAFYASSSCGACGRRDLESLHVARGRIDDPLVVSRAVLGRLPEALRAAQPTFEQSGGVHASGLFDAAGRLEALREDVGRHNAVDKLVGWALAEGRVPLAGRVLLLSGRTSFELVEKAVLAGVPLVAAVGAPSSMAVEVAEQHGVTLVGFLRPDSLNVYSHARRVAP
jgi:FdhD protein